MVKFIHTADEQKSSFHSSSLYSHVLPSMQREMMDQLDDFFKEE